MDSAPAEEYKQFKKYKVYKDGRIWSDRKKGFLTPNYQPFFGYDRVGFDYKCTAVHHIVARFWLEKPKSRYKLEINHKDGDKQNNHADNLEWVSHRENIQHAYRTGLLKTNLIKGDMHPRAKYTDLEIEMMMILVEKGYKKTDVARLAGCTSQYLSNLSSGTAPRWHRNK